MATIASSTGPAITSGTFSVTVYGVPVWSGDIDNPDGKTSADGTLDLAETLSVVPIDLVGVVEVSGSVSGTGGSCSGSAWVRIGGDPLTSIPGLVGLGAAILGLVGVISAVPGRPPGRGLIFGIMLGLGRALGETMAVTFVIGNFNQLNSLSLFEAANSITSALANECDPSRRPTRTSTPESFRLSAWAWPCEP